MRGAEPISQVTWPPNFTPSDTCAYGPPFVTNPINPPLLTYGIRLHFFSLHLTLPPSHWVPPTRWDEISFKSTGRNNWAKLIGFSCSSVSFLDPVTSPGRQRYAASINPFPQINPRPCHNFYGCGSFCSPRIAQSRS